MLFIISLEIAFWCDYTCDFMLWWQFDVLVIFPRDLNDIGCSIDVSLLNKVIWFLTKDCIIIVKYRRTFISTRSTLTLESCRNVYMVLHVWLNIRIQANTTLHNNRVKKPSQHYWRFMQWNWLTTGDKSSGN